MLRVHIDSFSGAASGLPKGHRQPEDVLRVLAKSPCVSTFDMSEYAWLRYAIYELQDGGLIESQEDASYPWLRYAVTLKGAALLNAPATQPQETK